MESMEIATRNREWTFFRCDGSQDTLFLFMRKGDDQKENIHEISIFILNKENRIFISVDTYSEHTYSKILENSKTHQLKTSSEKIMLYSVTFSEGYKTDLELLRNVKKVLNVLKDVDSGINEVIENFTISHISLT